MYMHGEEPESTSRDISIDSSICNNMPQDRIIPVTGGRQGKEDFGGSQSMYSNFLNVSAQEAARSRTTSSLKQNGSSDENIRVILRMRPFNDKEKQDGEDAISFANNSQAGALNQSFNSSPLGNLQGL